MPPTTHPEFPKWSVVKSEETGRVAGMRCPQCQARAEAATGDVEAGGGV